MYHMYFRVNLVVKKLCDIHVNMINFMKCFETQKEINDAENKRRENRFAKSNYEVKW